MALLAKVYFGDEIRMFELNERTVEEVSLKIHECFGITREDVDMFFVNEGRPFAIKQTQDLILGLRLVEDDGPVHIKLVVKREYRTMKGGEKSVALDCKQWELEQEEERQRQEAERRHLLEEQARELERQGREQEEERQRQEAERRRTEEHERQEREQEEKRQRLASAVTPQVFHEHCKWGRAAEVAAALFHEHCKWGRAAEVAAALEAVCGDPERLRALLEHRDGHTHTPLHGAAHHGQGEVVRLLLEAGADRDARDNVRSTPMHQAAWKGHGEVVRLLLEAGADRDARTNDGRRPVHVAQENGQTAIVELLR